MKPLDSRYIAFLIFFFLSLLPLKYSSSKLMTQNQYHNLSGEIIEALLTSALFLSNYIVINLYLCSFHMRAG